MVNQAAPARVAPPQPLPVFKLRYPLHGTGQLVERHVRVIEADDRSIKGFQVQHQFDDEPGRFRNFDRSKVVGLTFLHLAMPYKNVE